MDDLYTVLIIGAIIQIAILIVFFVMAGNVAAIKRKVLENQSFQDYIDKSNEEKFIGNYTNAKEWLLKAEYRLLKKKEEINDTTPSYLIEYRLMDINKHLQQIENLKNELLNHIR